MQKVDFVDLHIHSKFSIPSSKSMGLENIANFAKKRGVTIIGTGDILFPEWRKEVEKNMEFENGFYYFNNLRFVLTAEVNIIFEMFSSIKKFHAVLSFYDFKKEDEFKRAFDRYANFDSIARPNISIRPKDFLRIVEEIGGVHIILAHIFTPYYGILGANNNLNNVNEVFDKDVSQIIFVETGLSADPSMIFKVKHLRSFVALSNSDAHSLKNIGREGIGVPFSKTYDELFLNLKNKSAIFTIEEFSEIGKYYLDGHRQCKFKTNDFSLANCPICGKPLTKGVLHRIFELSQDESDLNKNPLIQKFYFFVPLKEILPLLFNKSMVNYIYDKILENFNSEYNFFFFNRDFGSYDFLSNDLITIVKNIKDKKLTFDYGYDGVYGSWGLLSA